MKKTVLITIASIALLVLGNGLYAYFNNTPNTKRISVSTFHDGKDGYSIIIPTENGSTCVWNYMGGNPAILHSETTEARTATDKHTVYINNHYDWIVTCVDDLGNNYTGIFPKK